MLNILCIVQTTVPSTEISIIRPFSYLEQQQKITWQLVKEAAFQPELLQQVDLVILHRNCHPHCRVVFDAARALAIPVIYEIDDNYFEIPEHLPIGRYFRNPNVVQTIEYLLRSADLVKIGSPELVPLISKYNQNLVYQPYAVDLTLLRDIVPNQNNRFIIGYAGTIDHHHDFEFLVEPILRIAAEFPEINWEFIGCLPDELKKLPRWVFTTFIPNYATFLQYLYQRNWQIGLCPILDLPHNRCKTDNKLREYGACRIPGIFSKIPPYTAVVKHGETGWLAENDGAIWYEAMKTLITHEELRRKIGNQVRKWVENERSIPVVAERWLDLFRQLLAKGSPK